MTKETRPTEQAPRDEHEKAAPRFVDPREVRRTPLGRLRTEEEARLAAEIEKLAR